MPLWSVRPVVDWVLHKGRHISDPEVLLGEMCDRVKAAGMPIDRVQVFISTLHPQYFGYLLAWENGHTHRFYGEHSDFDSDAYQHSPVADIYQGTRVVRRPMHRADCPIDYPVLEELRDDGYSDYVMVELVFSTGARNGVSLATRATNGFSDHDIEEVEGILHLFALSMENLANRGLAANLLDTYLGPLSGARVLNGQIKRGDGDRIDAVVWFSDLRESTLLAETLGHERFLELLNAYFEATAGAVLMHGGEVLRFIGDASLAVFPIAAADSIAPVCARALAAAASARARVIESNVQRSHAQLANFSCGIGLHRGEVLYGNIGTQQRLEFSVIGAAVNETARIEGLCKQTGHDVVLSDTVVRHLAQPTLCTALGRFSLRGVSREIDVYSLD